MRNENFAQSLGSRIRELRKMRGISQLDLATEMDVTLNTVSGIECGKTSPKVETLNRMSVALDVTLQEFFSFSDELHRDKNIRKKVENLSRQLVLLDETLLDLIIENVNGMIKIQHLKK